MTAKIIVHKKSQRVLLDLQKHQGYHYDGIKKGLHTIGVLVRKETKKLIRNPPKTGIKYDSLPNRSSAPHEAPATQTGELASSQKFKVRGASQLEVGSTDPKAKFLEDGTTRMKPRPSLLKAVNSTARDAQVILGNTMKDKI